MSDETRAIDVNDDGEDENSSSRSQEIESLSGAATSEETRGVDLKDEGADVSSALTDSQDIESLSDQTGEGDEGEGIAIQAPRYSSDGRDHIYEVEKVCPKTAFRGSCRTSAKVEPSWWSGNLRHLPLGVNLDNITKSWPETWIPKVASIVRCAKCNCYLQPQGTWIKSQVGSKELLVICVKSVKNLNQCRLVGAEFVSTDPHVNSINIKLTLRKEVVGTPVILERAYTIKFVIQDDMCESCSS